MAIDSNVIIAIVNRKLNNENPALKDPYSTEKQKYSLSPQCPQWLEAGWDESLLDQANLCYAVATIERDGKSHVLHSNHDGLRLAN